MQTRVPQIEVTCVIHACTTGVPQLMMSFTGEGQIKPELLESRDKRYGKSTSDLQRERAAALKPPQDTEKGADPWEPFGKVCATLCHPLSRLPSLQAASLHLVAIC